jgi:2'-5' RNA ligase
VRLFVALIPPENTLDEIEAAFAPCRDGRPGLRWIRRESWHVTLAFYGEVGDRAVPRLLPRLERAAGRHPRRELAFAGAGAFPRAHLRPIVEALRPYAGTPWTAGEIHLVQSHLGAEVRYETLHRWPLRHPTASR